MTYLPLGGEVAETSGDTDNEGVKAGKDVGGDDGVVGLCRGVHLGQDFLRESLGDSMVYFNDSARKRINKTHW